jgi:hypothetical protein
LLGWFPGLKWRRSTGSNMRTSASAGDTGYAGYTPAAATAAAVPAAATGSNTAAWQQQQQQPAAAGWGSGSMQYGASLPGGTAQYATQYNSAAGAGGSWGSPSSSSSISSQGPAAGLEFGKYGSFAAGGSKVGSVGSTGWGSGISQGLPMAGAGMVSGGTVGAGLLGGTAGRPPAPTPPTGTGTGTGAAGGAGAANVNVNVNVNPQGALSAPGGPQQPQGPATQPPQVQYQNPNLNFIPPRAAVTPRTQAVPQSAAAEFQQPGLSGVGLVWPPAGGVAGSSSLGMSSALGVGVPGLGGYQLLPPGYDEAAVRRAAEVCPGIQRIQAIQSRAGGVRGGASFDAT